VPCASAGLCIYSDTQISLNRQHQKLSPNVHSKLHLDLSKTESLVPLCFPGRLGPPSRKLRIARGRRRAQNVGRLFESRDFGDCRILSVSSLSVRFVPLIFNRRAADGGSISFTRVSRRMRVHRLVGRGKFILPSHSVYLSLPLAPPSVSLSRYTVHLPSSLSPKRLERQCKHMHFAAFEPLKKTIPIQQTTRCSATPFCHFHLIQVARVPRMHSTEQ
jgi:hypothetical protein